MDQTQQQQLEYVQKMQERNTAFSEQMQRDQMKLQAELSRQQVANNYHQQVLHEVMQPVTWCGSVGLVATFIFVLVSRGIRSGEARAIRQAQADEVVAKYESSQPRVSE